jgi:hypothetical protein
MNPLKRVETTIASLVEGTFGRVFRAEVRPMELARKLAREMDAHRTVSVSRTYVPNEYSVWLSARDRARYEGVEHEVIDELCAYLLEHARRDDLIMASAPRITFHTDEHLSLGEFGIQARLAPPEEEDHAGEGIRASAAPRQGEPLRPPAGAQQQGETMVFSSSARTREALEAAPAPGRPHQRVLLAVGSRRLLVPPEGGTVGRSRDCDVVLDDAGVSRRHAEIRPAAHGWTLEDLGSTNGVRVNGETLRGVAALHPGDRVELGSTEIVFEVA